MPRYAAIARPNTTTILAALCPAPSTWVMVPATPLSDTTPRGAIGTEVRVAGSRELEEDFGFLFLFIGNEMAFLDFHEVEL